MWTIQKHTNRRRGKDDMMGTRHLICIMIDGEYKLANYGQCDGYPEGQGVSVLEFMNSLEDRNGFIEKVKGLSFAAPEELNAAWVKAGANPNDEWVDYSVSKKFASMYPQYHRDAGAKILGLIQDGITKTKNELDFALNGLFCEWCYVIDFDENALEVYRGFTKSPLTEQDRFYHDGYSEDGYYPVKLAASFDLDSLPSSADFVAQLEPKEEYE